MAKPKPESKVIEEPNKPYEMTPLEVEAAQRVNGRLKGRPPAPWFPRRAARQTELARLGTVESDKTPGVYIRTGEAALADRLANAWAALAQEMEDAP
jgi:hypothetical protein